MQRIREPGFWYWLTTAILLLAAPLGCSWGVPMAAVATTVHLAHVTLRGHSIRSFPAQIRIGYLGLLLLGSLPGWSFIHLVQLAGTTLFLTTGYCPLARMLALAPWNRASLPDWRGIWHVLSASPRAGTAWQGLTSLAVRHSCHGDCLGFTRD